MPRYQRWGRDGGEVRRMREIYKSEWRSLSGKTTSNVSSRAALIYCVSQPHRAAMWFMELDLWSGYLIYRFYERSAALLSACGNQTDEREDFWSEDLEHEKERKGGEMIKSTVPYLCQWCSAPRSSSSDYPLQQSTEAATAAAEISEYVWSPSLVPNPFSLKFSVSLSHSLSLSLYVTQLSFAPEADELFIDVFLS